MSVLGQILAVANPNPLSGGRAGHTHTQPTGMLCVCVCVCVCVWVCGCGCKPQPRKPKAKVPIWKKKVPNPPMPRGRST